MHDFNILFQVDAVHGGDRVNIFCDGHGKNKYFCDSGVKRTGRVQSNFATLLIDNSGEGVPPQLVQNVATTDSVHLVSSSTRNKKKMAVLLANTHCTPRLYQTTTNEHRVRGPHGEDS